MIDIPPPTLRLSGELSPGAEGLPPPCAASPCRLAASCVICCDICGSPCRPWRPRNIPTGNKQLLSDTKARFKLNNLCAVIFLFSQDTLIYQVESYKRVNFLCNISEWVPLSGVSEKMAPQTEPANNNNYGIKFRLLESIFFCS